MLGLVAAGLILSATDVGSALLFATALYIAAVAVRCVGCAIDAPSLGQRLLWTGRALGLVGAAIAVSFPATLYQEIAVLVAQGRPLTYDIERAIWYEVGMMPLTIVPALVAFRWARAGGLLFVLGGTITVAVAWLQPFGEIYPEARGTGITGIRVLDLLCQPAFVTAGLLLVGAREVRAIVRTTER